MRACIVETGTVIEPFGDNVSESLVLDRPLKDLQETILRDLGFQVERVTSLSAVKPTPGPTLVLHDTLFFTPRLLDEFLETIRQKRSGGTFRLAVRKGLFTKLLAVLQETEETETTLCFPLWFAPEGSFNSGAAVPVQLDIDEESYEGGFPNHMIGKDGYRFCVTSRPILSITHPLHLAMANMAANFARLADLKKMSLFEKIGTVLRARSLNKFHILAAVSRIHPEAEVHPTAVVEGSVVEKGAKIGAYAVVKFSWVGEKAFVDDHAGIKFSVIGRESYIANNCVTFFSVTYPRCFLISGPYQFSLFGYDSAMMNAIPSDYRLDGKPVSIKTRRGVMSTGLRFVGSVLGHRTKIAAGIIVAPGRMIPNDLTIFPDPARVIQSVPEALKPGAPYFLVGGKLVQNSEKVQMPGETKSAPDKHRAFHSRPRRNPRPRGVVESPKEKEKTRHE